MLKDALVVRVLENPQVIKGRDSGRKLRIEFGKMLALGVQELTPLITSRQEGRRVPRDPPFLERLREATPTQRINDNGRSPHARALLEAAGSLVHAKHQIVRCL